MDDTKQIIRRTCEHAKVEPLDLLAYFLGNLRSRHLLKTATENPANVYEEIDSTRRAFTSEVDVPKTILAVLNMYLQLEQARDEGTAKAYKKAGKQNQADAASKNADTGKALLLIFKEIMNQAEHRGIEARLNMEKRWKEQDEGGEGQPPISKP